VTWPHLANLLTDLRLTPCHSNIVVIYFLTRIMSFLDVFASSHKSPLFPLMRKLSGPSILLARLCKTCDLHGIFSLFVQKYCASSHSSDFRRCFWLMALIGSLYWLTMHGESAPLCPTPTLPCLSGLKRRVQKFSSGPIDT